MVTDLGHIWLGYLLREYLAKSRSGTLAVVTTTVHTAELFLSSLSLICGLAYSAFICMHVFKMNDKCLFSFALTKIWMKK